MLTHRIDRRGPAAFLITLALLAGLAGCSGRERENPFDPLNPDTGGEPAAARALADCGRVSLSWSDLGMRDLSGFRIWRAAWQSDTGAGRPAETIGELLTPERLAPQTLTFEDTSAVNGATYVYRVEYCFGPDSAAACSSPVEARPGAARAWSADACGWGLALLAPDAGGVERIAAYGSAVLDLDIDISGGRLYAAQIDSGQVLVFRPSGERLPALEIAGASCVSWSADAGALAVGAFYESRVTWLTPEGEFLWTLEIAGQHPEDLAFRDRGTTWIALREGSLLRADLEAGRAETLDVVFERPVAIADDPGRGCWVADRGGDLVYVRDDGSHVRAEAGQFDQLLDADADGTGACWVADFGRGALVRVDREARVVSEIPGIAGVAGVTYDPAADALWVALPERGEVLFHALADGWQRRLFIGGCPRKLAGDWTGRCDR